MPELGSLPTLHRRITDWFGTEARELPWRDPGCSPWGVMVSEFMLQQTPVVRVLPIWTEWMRRWPTPGDLAAESAAEVIRAWGGLGYPRRALRLQTADGLPHLAGGLAGQCEHLVELGDRALRVALHHPASELGLDRDDGQ